jgi:hypothetical protein
MPRGRSAQLQRLFDLPLGESTELRPEAGDSVAAFLKRLKQVTYLYLRQGKAYRLAEQQDHVMATRVPVGSHRKLSYIRDLKTGERHFVAESLTWEEKKALLAKLDRVNGRQGSWQAEVEPDGFYIRRIRTPGEPLTWHERGEPEARVLTLAR